MVGITIKVLTGVIMEQILSCGIASMAPGIRRSSGHQSWDSQVVCLCGDSCCIHFAKLDFYAMGLV